MTGKPALDLLPAAPEPIALPADAKNWPARRVLAVDVGNSGSVALLDEAGALLAVEPLPTLPTGPAQG